MTFKEYAALAQRTSNNEHDKLLAGRLGLYGEGGEVVDMIKKFLVQSGKHPVMDKVHFAKEIGDVMWYVVEILYGRGCTSDDVFEEFDEAIKEETERFEHAQTRINESETLREESLMTVCADLALYTAQLMCGFYSGDHEFIMFLKRIVFTLILLLKYFEAGTMYEVMDMNIEKLRARYPEGFDPERSMHRAKGDV